MATWKKVVVESASGTIAQDTTGNAGTATTLETARNIALSGDVSGSASFDGSANVTINATVADDSHNHTISNVDGLQTALDAKQAADADLTAIAGLSNADGNFIVGNGTTWVAESGATVRSSLGLGSLATKSAIATGDITDGTILEADLNVTNAPTDGYILSYDNASTGFTWVANTAAANNATITLSPGAGIGAIGAFDTNQGSNETLTIGVDGVLEDLDTLGAAASDGQFIVATGAGAFAYESGNTVRTSMGLGTSNSPTFSGLTVNGDLTVSGTTTTINTATLEVEDKLIKVANVATPTTTTANGAGIQVEASATEAEWPEVKWNNGGALTGWTVANYKSTSNTDIPVSVMSHASGAPSADVAGVGSFYYDTSSNELYLQTGA